MNYLITGVNGSLGNGIAKYFIEKKNCKILCTSRGANTVSFNGQYKHIPSINLLEESHLDKLSKEAEEYFNGKFHIINAVGRYYQNGHQPFLDVSLKEADDIFNSNFKTVYNTANKLIPIQVQKGGGHFIGFSCTSVINKYPTMSAFSSSKAGLDSLIGSLANEHYKDKIIANSFQLSTLNTEEERKLKPHGDFNSWLNIEEIAEFLYNFISIEPSLISGNSIHIYKHSNSFFNTSFFERISK